MSSSVKFVAFAALMLLMNMHFAHCQYIPGYGYGGGYYPGMYGGCNNDNDMDALLPILLLALCGRGGFGGFGGYGGGCGCGGCGGGCGCGRC